MKVHLYFNGPKSFYSEKERRHIDNYNIYDNEFIRDWFECLHGGILEFDWDVIPNEGEEICFLTENGEELCAIVTKRTWCPSLEIGEEGMHVFIDVDIVRPDEITSPLYDKE